MSIRWVRRGLSALAAVLALSATAAVAQTVVINEVHYDQASGEQEFIELYAATGPVDMTGWTIADQDEFSYVIGQSVNPSFPCAGTFTLNAGDRLVLWQGAGTSVCSGPVRQVFLNRSTFLQKDGDDVVLRNGAAVCRDFVAFEVGPQVNAVPSGCAWALPNASNGNVAGRSISRFDSPLTDTNNGTDWEASGATTTTGPKSPGAANESTPTIACNTNQDCNDSNPCTDDTCQNPGTVQSACVRSNNNASCNDNNACTSPDSCSNGTCGGPSVCTGVVRLNEIFYDQDGGQQEFVELFVVSGGPVDMTGWTIADQDEMTYVIGRPSNPSFPCAGTFTVNTGDRIVLSQGSGTSVCTGTTRRIFMNRTAFLQKEGDDVVLRNGSNTCQDYVAFETGVKVNAVPAGCSWTGPNPSNGNVLGISISRFDNPFTDTDRGVDWEKSGQTSTTGPSSPGQQNVSAPVIACSTNPQCADTNPCTDDVCQNPGTPQSVCVHTNNTTPCNDNNVCTSGETCSNGSCGGGSVVCACSTNSQCADTNPCTDDVCQNPGTPQAQCVYTNNTASCSDGDPCTAPDTCSSGTCTPGQPVCVGGSVFINEVHYDQATGEREFVELYNSSGDSVDMTGWSIADQDELTYVIGRPANPSFPCAGTFTLNEGDRLVLWQGTGTSVCTGTTRQIFMGNATFLQKEGDDVVLRNGGGCQDYVAFETGVKVNPPPAGCNWTGPNPNNGNVAGTSISRFDNPFTDTDSGADWERSGLTTTTGTKSPGAQNVTGGGAICGNGVVDAGETCDDGNQNNNDTCSNNCTAGCGNGIVNTGEQCDDGNQNNSDACSNTCTSNTPCGNGVVDAGEQCDDGNASNTDGCLNTCQNATCGDGFTRFAFEECDDGNASNADACLNNCEAASCGDGFTRTGVEQCDDGNASNTDACLNSCQSATCGDGFTRAGVEQCDDGNLVNTDACPSTCQTATCGDGFVRAGVEQCDDGNLVNTDACPSTCQTATCGDGFTRTGVEQCDDGNLNDNDTCSNNCTAGCGNGIVNTGEQCDDGNQVDDDTCSNSCIVNAGRVLLTEVQYDQAGGGQEFIELLATGSVDISGWKLTDNDAPGATAFSMTFATSDTQFGCTTPFVLNSGDRLTVWQGTGTNVCSGTSRAIFLNRTVFLPASGDDLGLFDGALACKDYVAFGTAGAVPAGCAWNGVNPSNGGTDGRSVSRFDTPPVTDTDNGSDWEASGTTTTVGPASPGQPNHAAPTDTDGDGVTDSLDNCPTTVNPTQQDTNANGIGDACEGAGGKVLINEVQYDQGSGQEFVELLATVAPVGLTGWKLTDNDAPGATAFTLTFAASDPQFTCPVPFALFPGDRLVIHQGNGTNVCTGTSRAIYLNRAAFLPAAGDDLGLFDAGLVCKDYVAFETAGAVPAGCAWTGTNPATNVAGTSISRFNGPVVDTDAGADWEQSGLTTTTGPSSPGLLNSN